MSRSPELLTPKALRETLGSARERNAGERINEIEDALEMGTWQYDGVLRACALGVRSCALALGIGESTAKSEGCVLT